MQTSSSNLKIRERQSDTYPSDFNPFLNAEHTDSSD